MRLCFTHVAKSLADSVSQKKEIETERGMLCCAYDEALCGTRVLCPTSGYLDAPERQLEARCDSKNSLLLATNPTIGEGPVR